RDVNRTRLRGPPLLDSPSHDGIIHHVLHRVLPLSADKSAGTSGLRSELSEKASLVL
ncbi:E3 ubiquitin-protein ligase upl1, partial [Dionaea muscipula]